MRFIRTLIAQRGSSASLVWEAVASHSDEPVPVLLLHKHVRETANGRTAEHCCICIHGCACVERLKDLCAAPLLLGFTLSKCESLVGVAE